MEETDGFPDETYADLEDPEPEEDLEMEEEGADESEEVSRQVISLEEEKEDTESKSEKVSMTATAEEKPVSSVKAESGRQMIVVVNQTPVVLRGKAKYIFVDVFDYISFDLSKPQGAIVTTLNGKQAQFMEELHDGDNLEIYWRNI